MEPMAQELAIPGAGTTAKIRHPLGVLALGLITLGIYHVFWWYFINREMADLGRANRRPELGDSPILSVVAITIGALIIVPVFVSFWRTLKRIESSQNLVLGSNNFAVLLVFILGLIPLVNIVVAPLMQSNLNQVWEAGGRPAEALEPPPAEQPVEQPESPTTPTA
jgi:Domain of unknown function (DUF4234)